MTKESQATDDTAVLSAVFDAAVDAIVVSDVNGTIRRANSACGRLFGQDVEEMVGQNVNILMPRRFSREHDDYIDRHISTGEKRIIGIGREVEGIRKDGTVFPLHLSVGRAELSGETLFIGILHDLSERRDTLEALSRSQRLDAIGKMTGGIAHDFNNLLTVIIGNLELLRLDGDPKAQERVTDALEAAELGAELTARLLAFGRKSALVPRRLSLAEKCDEVIGVLRRTLGEQYIIEARHSAGDTMVYIDPGQFQTAILNLAINSRDAMPDGGRILIETEVVRVDDSYIAQEVDVRSGTYVRLSISDTGAGMNEEAQMRAFEPFFTTKEEGKGTGLGLSMVYGFVRQSGGHVTLYSEVGQGTTMSLYFEAMDEPVAGEEPQPEPVGTPFGKGETVLVVEDNDKVRRLSVARVKDLGYTPIEAENGEAALALLRDFGRVDLLFSDVIMPGRFNGFDLARIVRDEFPEIAILLTTGYASEVMAEEDDAFTVLRKPYRLQDLAGALRVLLDA